MDGPSPAYFVVGGEKVPLTPKDVRSLDKECRWIASLSIPQMVEYMESLLRFESGQSPSAHLLMGFLREEPTGGTQDLNLSEDAAVPTQCDYCAATLVDAQWAVDGITTEQLQWAWMCVRCFLLRGCGLGLGWGQLYRRGASGKWAFVDRAPRASDGSDLDAYFMQVLTQNPSSAPPRLHAHADTEAMDHAARELDALFSEPGDCSPAQPSVEADAGDFGDTSDSGDAGDSGSD